jgi:hypothetical protein
MPEQTSAMNPIAPPLPDVLVQQNAIFNVSKIVPKGQEGEAARKVARKAGDKACASIEACVHSQKCKKCSVCGRITRHKTAHRCKTAPDSKEPDSKEPSGGGSKQQRAGPPKDIQAPGTKYKTPKAAYIFRGVKMHNNQLQSQGKSKLGAKNKTAKELGELRSKLSQEFTNLDQAKKEQFIVEEYTNILKPAPKKPEFNTMESTKAKETRAKNSITSGLELMHGMGLRGIGIVMEPGRLDPFLVYMPPELVANSRMHATLLQMMACLVGAPDEAYMKNPRPMYPGEDASIFKMLKKHTRGELESALVKRWKAVGGPLDLKGNVPWKSVSTGEVLVGGWPMSLPVKLKMQNYSKLELAIIQKVRWKPQKAPLSCVCVVCVCVCCLCHRCRQLMLGFARRHCTRSLSSARASQPRRSGLLCIAF